MVYLMVSSFKSMFLQKKVKSKSRGKLDVDIYDRILYTMSIRLMITKFKVGYEVNVNKGVSCPLP